MSQIHSLLRWLHHDPNLIENKQCWLAFCQLDTSQDLLRREDFSWGNASIRLNYKQICGGIFWLMIDVGGSISLCVILSLGRLSGMLFKQADDQVMGSKACKEHVSTFPASVIASKSLPWGCRDFSSWWTVNCMVRWTLFYPIFFWLWSLS